MSLISVVLRFKCIGISEENEKRDACVTDRRLRILAPLPPLIEPFE